MKGKVLVVVGGTGVGKSRLGVRLAKALDGEVVNADAMQMYAGLPLATAKPTAGEMAGVPHHLLGTEDPLASPLTVREYRDRALRVFEDVWTRGKLPVLVGGTLYYVQSLVWSSLLDEQPEFLGEATCGDASAGAAGAAGAAGVAGAAGSASAASPPSATTASSRPPEHAPPTPPPTTTAATAPPDLSLHERLRLVDPVRASQLHPNDVRKIARSLQVYEQTGKPHSAAVSAETLKRGGSDPPRFDFRILWLTCDAEAHHERLKKRVEAMLGEGLIEEVRAFLATVPPGVDRSKGIFQSMGLKEMEPALAAPPGDRAALARSLDLLVMHHRQYVRKQIHWIRRRVLARNVPVYAIDTTRAETRFEEDVAEPALAVARGLVQSTAGILEPPFPAGPHPLAKLANVDPEAFVPVEKRLFTCEDCDGRTIVGTDAWAAHLAGRIHRRNAARRRGSNPDQRKQDAAGEAAAVAAAAVGGDEPSAKAAKLDGDDAQGRRATAEPSLADAEEAFKEEPKVS